VLELEQQAADAAAGHVLQENIQRVPFDGGPEVLHDVCEQAGQPIASSRAVQESRKNTFVVKVSQQPDLVLDGARLLFLLLLKGYLLHSDQLACVQVEPEVDFAIGADSEKPAFLPSDGKRLGIRLWARPFVDLLLLMRVVLIVVVLIRHILGLFLGRRVRTDAIPTAT
jgi:hypothetical protein